MLKFYIVTITPKLVAFAGNYRMGEYTLEVTAKTASEAISVARRRRSSEEGRYAVPATYRAALVR